MDVNNDINDAGGDKQDKRALKAKMGNLKFSHEAVDNYYAFSFTYKHIK